jgi:type I restriction enzyme M protein
VYGIDKDAVAVKLTKAIMKIPGDGSAHCARGDAIRTHRWASDCKHLNSGGYEDGRCSVVMTNPPFGANLTVSAEDARLAGLDIARVGNAYRDLEIGLLFLNRAYKLLRDGGRLESLPKRL